MQRHRPGGSAAPRLRTAARFVLAGYLLFVAWLTLRPLTVPWIDPASLELFATVERELARGPREALRTLGGEVLLLSPLGVLLPLASAAVGSWIGSFVRTVSAGGLLALGLEALRSVVAGQMLNVDSLLLNTTGVALAHLLLLPVVRRIVRRPERRERRPRQGPGRPGRLRRAAQGLTPRAPRVDIAPWADASGHRAPYV
ncbi:VanZ family protein [Streptomyces sp. 549]|uniref:VanZ family protein n=1 Tax=Streptomyces sp. 549 TaxID=3049076 RepID=UPI0024C289AB|nr:VanZ family protein [Streptomyces sp. 549]MDK1472699.1 VanZ family protein [Streptomyces sp. 549]